MKPSFFRVFAMLWDRAGWRYTGRSDEVTYRDTGYRFYLEQACVALRQRSNAVEYEPNLLAWAVFSCVCPRIRVMLNKTP